MSSEEKREFVGPIEELEWTKRLKAHVVTPGPRPRIHGYDVEGDLSRNYSFAESVFLALTGRVPDERTGRAFDLALQYLSPVAVTEAPSHASVLARMCGASPSGVCEVAAIGLAEQARYILHEHRPFIEWLRHPEKEIPEDFRAESEDDVRFVKNLKDRLNLIGLLVPALEHNPTRMAALIALIHLCGVTESAQMSLIFVLARLAVVGAEALAVDPGSFVNYPIAYPRFRYEE
jgi:hypothetical protein